MLVGCQHAPSSLLKKAMQMENVSVDSIFFYLQQIDKPENLSSKQQGDYYFLSYKATLWKTGKPVDSLLQTAAVCNKESTCLLYTSDAADE